MMGRTSSKMLSHLDVDGIEVTGVKQICGKFNSQFTMNPKSLLDSLPSPNVIIEFPSNNSSMYLCHAIESEVLTATKNLKKIAR